MKTDLKLIDDLLILLKEPQQTWSEFEHQYNTVSEAMNRLRVAYRSGEMPKITLSLALYFNKYED